MSNDLPTYSLPPVAYAPPVPRPVARRGLVVTVLLAVAVVVDLVAVLGAFSRLDLIERLLADATLVTDAEIARSDAAYTGIGAAQLFVLLATGVAFIVWLVRAYDNAEMRLAYRLRHSRGWAIGSWFVPFLNFVRPKQIVDDVWRASRPDREATPTVPPYVHLWWLAFLLSGLVQRVIVRGTDDSTLEGLRSATRLGLLSDVLSLVAGLLAIVVVVQLTNRQRTWIPADPA